MFLPNSHERVCTKEQISINKHIIMYQQPHTQHTGTAQLVQWLRLYALWCVLKVQLLAGPTGFPHLSRTQTARGPHVAFYPVALQKSFSRNNMTSKYMKNATTFSFVFKWLFLIEKRRFAFYIFYRQNRMFSIRWPRNDTDSTLPFNAEVKNLWSHTFVQHTLLSFGTLWSTGTTLHFYLKAF